MQLSNSTGENMAKHSGFSDKQVADAIRAGLREGRRPARMSVSRAAERAAAHRSIRARYQEHGQQSQSAGDYLQVAEKSWGAYAQTIKALVSEHRWRATHHSSIIGVADQLALLAGQSDAAAGETLRHGLSTARSLHQHFYEEDLSDQMVVTNAADVSSAIDLMQELFSPNGAAA